MLIHEWLADILDRQSGYPISPIAQINGEDPVEYLTRFAALNSVGKLEPHADWNSLMTSPVQLIQSGFNTFFGGATFYDGPDLNFVFDNGTTMDTEWFAIYNPSYYTGPLTTGGDFYNLFVLGLLPASYSTSDVPCVFREGGCNNETNESPEPSYSFESGWDDYTDDIYPAAQVKQEDLADLGWVTGYYLDDISTGVLSLPSFDESGWALTNFSAAVQRFISGAQDRNTSKIIIDLQGNSGGAIILAFSVFYSFFPATEPFAGSRRRSHHLADVLGTTLTNSWGNQSPTEDNYTVSVSSEWVVTDRLNAENGRNFTSWAEYYGPRQENDDLFSLVVSITEQHGYLDWSGRDADANNQPGTL